MTDRLGLLCLLIGCALFVYGRIIHLTFYPHWSEAQALMSIWPLWVAGFGCVLAGLVRVLR